MVLVKNSSKKIKNFTKYQKGLLQPIYPSLKSSRKDVRGYYLKKPQYKNEKIRNTNPNPNPDTLKQNNTPKGKTFNPMEKPYTLKENPKLKNRKQP